MNEGERSIPICNVQTSSTDEGEQSEGDEPEVKEHRVTYEHFEPNSSDPESESEDPRIRGSSPLSDEEQNQELDNGNPLFFFFERKDK